MNPYKILKEFFWLYNVNKYQLKALTGDIQIFFASIWWYIILDRVFFSDFMPFSIPSDLLELSFYGLVLTTVIFIYWVSLKTIMKLNEENSYMLFFIRLTIHILSFLISFGFIYSFVWRLYPGAFNWITWFFDYFYYSVVTFSTVWFWDISPQMFISKMITTWEIVSSYLFIILVIWNVWKIKDNLSKTNKDSYLEAYEEREEEQQKEMKENKD